MKAYRQQTDSYLRATRHFGYRHHIPTWRQEQLRVEKGPYARPGVKNLSLLFQGPSEYPITKILPLGKVMKKFYVCV